MRWTIPAALLLLALPLGAVAANRVGDADCNGSLNATDAALVQARVLGVVDEWSISPLALADGDADLDLSDILLVAQAATGQRVISGPGGWLSFVDPGAAFALSGGPPVPLLWGVYSNFYGVAENTDGLGVGFTKLPGTAQSTLAAPTATVTGLGALAQLNPLITTGGAQNVTVRMTLAMQDSSGASLSNAIRNAIVNVSSSNCGDGVMDGGEECDDGNGIDEDGCTTLCMPDVVMPHVLGSVSALQGVMDVVVYGSHAVVLREKCFSCFDYEIVAVDISNPMSPYVVGTFPISTPFPRLSQNGGLVFESGPDQTAISRINPFLQQSIVVWGPLPAFAGGGIMTAAIGTTLYTSQVVLTDLLCGPACGGGIYLVTYDISDPTNPILTGTNPIAYPAGGGSPPDAFIGGVLAVSGNTVCSSAEVSRFFDGASPNQVGSQA